MEGQRSWLGALTLKCFSWLVGWSFSPGILKKEWRGSDEQSACGPPSLLFKLGVRKWCSPCVYGPLPPARMAELDSAGHATGERPRVRALTGAGRRVSSSPDAGCAGESAPPRGLGSAQQARCAKAAMLTLHSSPYGP